MFIFKHPINRVARKTAAIIIFLWREALDVGRGLIGTANGGPAGIDTFHRNDEWRESKSGPTLLLIRNMLAAFG